MRNLLFVLFSIGIQTPSYSQNAEQEATDLVRTMANELLKNSHLPGMSIAVSKHGKIIFAEGFGYADVENKAPVTIKTQFRTASVAKVITATAVGKLVQDGKLDLAIPVQKYVPFFPIKSFPINSRQLAGHIGGFDKIENRFYTSVKDALGVFSHEDLIAEPGTKYSYSTHGYTLLSAVIEGASDMNYLEYMNKEIFEPLHMTGTQPDTRTQQPNSNSAKLYAIKNNIQEEIKNPEEVSYKWAGGGFVSTPIDLINLTTAYTNGFLKPDIVKMMFESQSLKSGDKTQVGIGWRISQDIGGRQVMEHAGSMQGARSVVCFYPNEQIAISIMVNAEWASSIEETAHMMVQPFFNNTSKNTLAAQGKFNISMTIVNGRGEEITVKGTLALINGFAKIALEADQENSIIYLGIKNVFALVRPDGIYYCTIDFNERSLSGKAIAYGSRLSSSPITNPPFVKFISSN